MFLFHFIPMLFVQTQALGSLSTKYCGDTRCEHCHVIPHHLIPHHATGGRSNASPGLSQYKRLRRHTLRTLPRDSPSSDSPCEHCHVIPHHLIPHHATGVSHGLGPAATRRPPLSPRLTSRSLRTWLAPSSVHGRASVAMLCTRERPSMLTGAYSHASPRLQAFLLTLQRHRRNSTAGGCG